MGKRKRSGVDQEYALFRANLWPKRKLSGNFEYEQLKASLRSNWIPSRSLLTKKTKRKMRKMNQEAKQSNISLCDSRPDLATNSQCNSTDHNLNINGHMTAGISATDPRLSINNNGSSNIVHDKPGGNGSVEVQTAKRRSSDAAVQTEKQPKCKEKKTHTENVGGSSTASCLSTGYAILTRSKTGATSKKIENSRPFTYIPHMMTLEYFLGKACVNDIPGDPSTYEPYDVKELAAAQARLKWEAVYGSLQNEVKVKAPDTAADDEQGTGSNLWDGKELFRTEFPMPHVGCPDTSLLCKSETLTQRADEEYFTDLGDSDFERVPFDEIIAPSLDEPLFCRSLRVLHDRITNVESKLRLIACMFEEGQQVDTACRFMSDIPLDLEGITRHIITLKGGTENIEHAVEKFADTLRNPETLRPDSDCDCTSFQDVEKHLRRLKNKFAGEKQKWIQQIQESGAVFKRCMAMEAQSVGGAPETVRVSVSQCVSSFGNNYTANHAVKESSSHLHDVHVSEPTSQHSNNSSFTLVLSGRTSQDGSSSEILQTNARKVRSYPAINKPLQSPATCDTLPINVYEHPDTGKFCGNVRDSLSEMDLSTCASGESALNCDTVYRNLNKTTTSSPACYFPQTVNGSKTSVGLARGSSVNAEASGKPDLSQKLCFWRNVTTIFSETNTVKSKLQSTHSMFHQGKEVELACKQMTDVHNDLEDLKKRMKYLDNEKQTNQYPNRIPRRLLKEVGGGPREEFNFKTVTARLMKLCRTFENTRNRWSILMLKNIPPQNQSSAGTVFHMNVGSTSKHDSLTVSSVDTVTSVELNVTEPSANCEQSSMELFAEKVAVEAPLMYYVMSLAETKHWGKLQELNTLMWRYEKSIKRRIGRLLNTNTFNKAVSSPRLKKELLGVKARIDTFSDKLQEEKIQNEKCAFPRTRPAPGRVKERTVTDIQQVDRMLATLKDTFLSLLKYVGYEHILNTE